MEKVIIFVLFLQKKNLDERHQVTCPRLLSSEAVGLRSRVLTSTTTPQKASTERQGRPRRFAPGSEIPRTVPASVFRG